MEISQEWLEDWVDLDGLDDQRIDAALTRIGHAVEGVERHDDGRVLELEITTNRIDAMSHRGLARELAAALDRPMKTETELVEIEGLPGFDITIQKGSGCSRFAGLRIEGVTVGPSPEWLQDRLKALGHRPVNNIVDATNYVMLDMGHPLHAFDLDRLAGPKIVVRRGSEGEKIETLDGETREIDERTIVIADADGPVGLGGVMGGASSEISASTRNVLLECAYFDPATIRLTARRLNMNTDASYRFERGVDPNDIPETIRRCAAMVIELGGGKATAYEDVVAIPHEPKSIRLRNERLIEISDQAVDVRVAEPILEKLGMEPERVGDDLDVSVPTWRGDISGEIDLVEEVLRVHGYERIPSSLPRLSTGDVFHEEERELEETLRNRVSGYGLSEVVTYSFQSRDLLALFTSERPLRVENALSETVEAMRPTLLGGLAEIAGTNYAQGNRDGAIFEVARTYHDTGEQLREVSRLGFAMWGSRTVRRDEPKLVWDLFDATGLIDALAATAGSEVEWRPDDASWAEEGAAAAAWIDGERVGAVGQVRAPIRDRLELKGSLVCGEIETEALRPAGTTRLREVSRFPGVPMVLAVRHDESISWSELEGAVREEEIDLLAEVGLWDRYEEEDRIKTTLAMWYQATDRSLSQEEVGSIHESLAETLARKLPVEIVKEEK